MGTQAQVPRRATANPGIQGRYLGVGTQVMVPGIQGRYLGVGTQSEVPRRATANPGIQGRYMGVGTWGGNLGTWVGLAPDPR